MGASIFRPTLCYKEIRVGLSSKIRVLPSGTLPQGMDIAKFRHGKSIVRSTKLVDVPACGSHLATTRSVVGQLVVERT